MDHLDTYPVKKYSGFGLRLKKLAATRVKNVKVLSDNGPAEDQPRDLITGYIYEKGRPKAIRNYVAKVGNEWYPGESITEHLISQFGVHCNFKMSRSKLVFIDGQLRFLRENPRKKQTRQRLIEGALLFTSQIDSGSLDESVRQKVQSGLVSYQLCAQVLKSQFPHHFPILLRDFNLMLLFDALVGNSNRHLHSWGVVKDAKDVMAPYIAPIFDTVQALFWNFHEDDIRDMKRDLDRGFTHHIDQYLQDCPAKLSWEGYEDVNHFKLIELLITEQAESIRMLYQEKLAQININRCLMTLSKEFRDYVPGNRLALIEYSLQRRFEIIEDLVRQS